jgi:hypothetical protein
MRLERPLAHLASRREDALGQTGHGIGDGNAVVPMQAGHLLHQIDLLGDVVAVRGDRDLQGIAAGLAHLHAEPAEDGTHFSVVDLRAQHTAGALGAEAHLARRGGPGMHIDPSAGQPPARHLHQQPGRAVRRTRDALRIHAALEAIGGLGAESQCLRAGAHPRRVEVRAFDENACGLRRHLGRFPAHDPGDADGTRSVRDHQLAGGQLPLDAVQRHQRLAGRGRARVHLAGGNRVEVIGMERLAAFEEDEVGDVDDVVARPRSHELQADRQPERRGGDRDPFHDAGDETGASLQVVDHDARAGLGGAIPLQGLDRLLAFLRKTEAPASHRDHLARDPQHAQAVAAIVGDLRLEDPVVEPEHLRQGKAGSEALVERHESGSGARPQAQFLAREEHPVRLHAADGARLDRRAPGQHRPGQGQRGLHPGTHVGRTADDLHLSPAARHPAAMQVIGQRGGLQHPPHHDPAPRVRRPFHALHRRPGQGKPLRQRVRIQLGAGEFADPVVEDLHG